METSRRRRGPGRPGAHEAVPELEQVLDRALEAFAEHGYEAVSLRQLNAHLGMGHTFISDRYGSKEAFWKVVVEHAFDQVRPEVAAALVDDGKDELERLVAAVRALHRALSRSAHFAGLMDQEARVESPRLAYLYELMAPWLDGIKPLFTRLVERGDLRPMPWYLFHFLITAPSSLYSQPPLARRVGRPDDADDHDLMTDLVLGGLLGTEGSVAQDSSNRGDGPVR
ncbi:TetR/AcrR family transcriptional regulator [Promicromonospora vindobonensis]|uniref:TetR/AcrR family transcriptional regulator n=1 Tax=Promicromonospora vindobonensis TaxID=195748 RepID=A0ABW5VXT1_9MICO